MCPWFPHASGPGGTTERGEDEVFPFFILIKWHILYIIFTVNQSTNFMLVKRLILPKD